jgi:uncharacterized protein with NRDE domain
VCTLIVLHRCFAEADLVIAANRDEYLDRPAEPPTLRHAAARRILAPRDLRAGGTWLGVNDRGLVAALTNRPAPRRDPELRSRGLLVEDALAAEGAAEAVERVARTAARGANPFNLFVCDRDEAFVVVGDERAAVRELAPGPHVIGNADPDDGRVPKVARLLRDAEQVAAGAAHAALETLAAVCRVHGVGASPLEDTCIHAGGYGTRSSTLLRRGALGDALHFADGPPCENPYIDLTPLLWELGLEAALPLEAAQRNP